jgi:NAD+ synthase (glutamine-hydrolysing)
MNNLIKVGSAVPRVIVGNVKENVKNILSLISEAHKQGCKFVVFPELCVTGYTCGDLFRTSKLLHEAKEGVDEITRNMPSGIIAIVGSPNVYNSAFIVGRDHHWVVNKTYLPSYNEFYEGRWFKESEEEPQVFQAFGVKFGVEICEDLWAPLPPSTKLVQGGAEIIFNLSASNELIGKHEYLKSLVSQQSGRLICGYVYSSAGYGESTQDLVYPGKSLIAENGKLLVDKCGTSGLSVADIDLDIIRHDRLVNTSFRKFIQPNKNIKQLYVGELNVENPIRKYKSKVFSVKNKAEYEKIKDIQVQALMTRLEHTGLDPVIGISGGSDSTWALLICYEAIKKLGRGKIIGITMPGFATSQRTKSNSLALMTALGIEPREIDIRNICKAELEALGHDLTTQDITYENVQARTRTQILMNVSNQEHGLVIGTGDLSELALGWCTYNAVNVRY